jgi:hypothetical protein
MTSVLHGARPRRRVVDGVGKMSPTANLDLYSGTCRRAGRDHVPRVESALCTAVRRRDRQAVSGRARNRLFSPSYCAPTNSRPSAQDLPMKPVARAVTSDGAVHNARLEARWLSACNVRKRHPPTHTKDVASWIRRRTPARGRVSGTAFGTRPARARAIARAGIGPSSALSSVIRMSPRFWSNP